MAAPVLQFKRGLLANLPGLRAGEPGFTTDSYDLYVGLTSETSTNKFFGSHRYWTKETTSTGSGLNLVEGTSNGSDYITIKSPDSLAGIVTYTLPGTQGATSSVLTNDGSGNLTWSSGSANPVFTGIATFTDTTDNTLGDADTGAVQIDGGLGVNKNVTVGAGLSVAGESYFIGTATFYGGTINLGDSDTDDINVAGEFVSNLVPNTDDTYDIGNGGASKRWRHASFSGIGTFATGLVADSVRLGIGGAGSVDTTIGNLTLDSASGLTVVNDNLEVQGNADIDFNLNVDGQSVLNNDLSVAGVSTFTGLVDANGGLDVLGHTELDDVNISGIATIANLDVQTDFDIYAPTSTFHNSVIIEGDLTVNGTETIINTTTLTVQDKEIILGVGTNGSPSDASASGGGVSIASTEGAPLADFYIAGIHTHPNTYKDIIWIRADDLGVGTTDAWHFNYAVGIGSTQVPNGVRFAVTNTQITDDTLSTPQVNVSGASTVGGLLDVNGGLDVSGGETVLSSATVSDLTQGRVVLAGASGSLEDSTNLTFDAGGLIVGAGGINVTGVSTFSTDLVVGGDVTVTGNDIKASDGNTNITLTSNTLTTFAGDIKVTGNDIQSSTATALTLSGADVTVAGDLTVGGNDIKASDGTTALTLANSTGAVTAANDLTVQGNLYVSGNTTQVNTAALTVEDRTIDLGIVNGAAPASATTWDLGVLFNYYTGGAAKKSAVVWEHADTRFKFASVLGADTNGSDNDTPQLTVTTFAPIEIGALWVTDCAGTSQVISCTGTERFLENITVDAGTF